MKFVPALLVALLAGCASTTKYEAQLDRMIGLQEGALLRNWGPPSSWYESDGTKYLVYHRGESVNLPGLAPNYRVTGNVAAPYGGSPAFGFDFYCTTTLHIRDGMIVSWRWKGNDCASR